MAKSESVSTSISCEVRPSSGSTPSSVGSEVICRICHSEAEPEQPLISPCLCAGTLKFVHQECLHHWIKSSDLRYCELCKFVYMMKITTKPFSKVRSPNLCLSLPLSLFLTDSPLLVALRRRGIIIEGFCVALNDGSQ